MKSRRSLVWNPQFVAVWNHHEVMHGIKPKGDTRRSVMPYACGDSIHACVVITYQSFGLDRKKQVARLAFFWLGWPDSDRRMPESKSGALPLGYTPIFSYIILYHISQPLSIGKRKNGDVSAAIFCKEDICFG